LRRRRFSCAGAVRAALLALCVVPAGCQEAAVPKKPATMSLPAAVASSNVEQVRANLAGCGMMGGRCAVNALNAYGETPLHIAAMVGNAEIVDLLLDAGAHVNAQLPDGSTPLHSAMRAGNHEVARHLLKSGAYPDARTRSGLSPWEVGDLQAPEDVIFEVQPEDWVQEGLRRWKTPVMLAMIIGLVVTVFGIWSRARVYRQFREMMAGDEGERARELWSHDHSATTALRPGEPEPLPRGSDDDPWPGSDGPAKG
jgi:hypothetical protein